MPSAIRGPLRHRFSRAFQHDPRLRTSYRRWRDTDHPNVDETSDVLVDGFYGSGNARLVDAARASHRRFLKRWRASWTGSDAGLTSIPPAHRASERRGPSNG